MASVQATLLSPDTSEVSVQGKKKIKIMKSRSPPKSENLLPEIKNAIAHLKSNDKNKMPKNLN